MRGNATTLALLIAQRLDKCSQISVGITIKPLITKSFLRRWIIVTLFFGINNFSVAEECRDILLGSSTKVDLLESSTQLSRKYILTRDSAVPQRFHVTIPIAFHVTYSSLASKFAEEMNSSPLSLEEKVSFKGHVGALADRLSEEMMSKTIQCYKSWEGYLKSSDGTDIRLKFARSSEGNSISIVSEGGRHNARQWGTEIDCPTIIHESLHLLGLVDGYRETQIEGLFDCRSLEPKSSIMTKYNQSIGLNDDTFYDVKQCFLERGLPNLKQVNDLNTATCPKESGHLIEYVSRRGLMAVASSGKYFYFYAPSKATPRFPLEPAHTRYITKPFCTEANAKYLNCAQNSQRTKSTDGCVSTPTYCESEEYLK